MRREDENSMAGMIRPRAFWRAGTRRAHALKYLLIGAVAFAVACGAQSLEHVDNRTPTRTAGAGGGGSGGANSAGGGTGGDGASAGTATSGAGGSLASGGNAAVGGTSGGGAGVAGHAGGMAGTSGAAASGGGGGVCLCPAVACSPAVTITVKPQSGSGSEMIEGLKAEGTGVNLNCTAHGGTPCEWACYSTDFRLSDGDYSVTFTASGYDSKTLDFSVTNPTNCGCCGCPCGIGYQGTVELAPSAEPVTSGCCADLDTDPNNCGACGRKCPANGCGDGKCVPSFGACVFPGSGADSCDEYCASVGQVCSASCGANADEASEEWISPTQNCYDAMQTPTVRGCSDPFGKVGPNNYMPQYDCCCGDP